MSTDHAWGSSAVSMAVRVGGGGASQSWLSAAIVVTAIVVTAVAVLVIVLRGLGRSAPPPASAARGVDGALWKLYQRRQEETRAALTAAIAARESWKAAVVVENAAQSRWYEEEAQPEKALKNLEKDGAQHEASREVGEVGYRENAKGGPS